MKFKMNGIEYEILEVGQEEFEGYDKNSDGYFFGQSKFYVQKIYLDKTLPKVKMRKTLYHELMHTYIKEFITNVELTFDEEELCDISANAHDIIHQIVEEYFKERNN